MAAKFSQDHSVTLVLSQFMIHLYCPGMFLFFDATRLLVLLHCSFIYIKNPNTHRHTPELCEGFLVCITVSLAPTFTCLYFYISHGLIQFYNY